MDGWIALSSGQYVKPIDWEEILVIKPDQTGYQVFKMFTDGRESLLCRAGSPAAAARMAMKYTARALSGAGVRAYAEAACQPARRERVLP